MSRWIALAAVLILAAAVATVTVGTPRPPAEDEPAVRPAETDSADPETLAEQVERVARAVEDIRGIQFAATPEITTLTQSALQDRIAEELRSYTAEDAASDEHILLALGAIAEGTDLRALIIRGFSEQVGGFYDPETGELVVGTEDPSRRLGRLEEIILAHELEHALVDEVLGLPEMEDVDDGEEDRALAGQALVEGSATVTMQRYIEVGFSVVDQLLLPGELARLEEQLAGFTELPHYVQRGLTFPYEEGAVFVQHLLGQGGWDAVDEAFAVLPTTTAEIIFPDRYPLGEPPAAPASSPPGTGWELERRAAFGAADLLFLFEAPGDDPTAALSDPRAVVAEWRAGELRLYTAGENIAVAIALRVGGPGLCPAVEAWYDAAHHDDRREGTAKGARWLGGVRSATLVCDDDTILLAIAPSEDVADAMVAAG